MSEDKKIIFSMSGVSKTLPHNNKTIIKDIYLSFFYGAKIGILGLNGSGKSTLLKIIAGVEKNYQATWSGRRATAWVIWSRSRSWMKRRP